MIDIALKMPESSANHFVHDRLESPASDLRLLRLRQGGPCASDPDNGQLQFELSTWRAGNWPTYVAISYTWGNAQCNRTISVNGKSVSVSHNCWYVLQQASSTISSEYLWIDAICIDQQDDDEKSHQVAMMGSIYKSATRVLACIGPHEDDSSTIFFAVPPYISFINQELQRAQDSGLLWSLLKSMQGIRPDEIDRLEKCDHIRIGDFSLRVIAQLQGQLNFQAHFRKFSREELEALAAALYAMSERSYFSRLWILQELLLGQRVVAMCGSESLPFHELLLFEDHFVEYCLYQKTGNHSGIEWSRGKRFESLVNAWAQGYERDMGLLELTDYFCEFQCSDARDRVFGVLAMVDWQGYAPLVPDYRKSTLELACQAISYMCPLGSGDNKPMDRSERTIPSNDNWPIVSAGQIAIALGLDARNKDVDRLLRKRRERRGVLGVHLESKSLPGVKEHVEVMADHYCQLFNDRDDDGFVACLVERQMHSSFYDEELPPGYELVLKEQVQEVAFKNVCNSGAIRAQVIEKAQHGDFLLSFQSSGSNIGLVARKVNTGTNTLQIVGQAILQETTRFCQGSSVCSCSLDAAMHPEENTRLIVHFDPEDLLLFACQSFVTAHEDTISLPLWRDVEAGKDIRPCHIEQAGEVYNEEQLYPLRLMTPVVQSRNELSSFVTIRKYSSGDAESQRRIELVSELNRHFNARSEEQSKGVGVYVA